MCLWITEFTLGNVSTDLNNIASTTSMHSTLLQMHTAIKQIPYVHAACHADKMRLEFWCHAAEQTHVMPY